MKRKKEKKEEMLQNITDDLKREGERKWRGDRGNFEIIKPKRKKKEKVIQIKRQK